MHDVISSTDKKAMKVCFKFFFPSRKWGNPRRHRLLSGTVVIHLSAIQ